MTMIGFEIKKIFSKNSSRIALAVLAVIIAVICITTLRSPDLWYVNENGDTEKGVAAIHKLKDAKEEWKGPLTEERLSQVIAELNRINASPEANSADIQQNDIAYGRAQGLSDIRDMLNDSFRGFGQYDYYIADSLTEEDAADFYTNRTEALSEWLNEGAGASMYTDSEKAYITNRYEELVTPLDYECADGWKMLIQSSPTLLMLMAFAMIFLSSGIFSGEYALGADPVFFASRYGRDKAVRSKIWAGVIMVSVIYGAVMLIYTAVMLIILGAGGGGSPLQTSFGMWLSMYNVSMAGAYALIVICGYAGTIFISLLSMFISVKSRSAVIAIVIPFVVMFVPLYFPDGMPGFLDKITALLPDQAMQVSLALEEFKLCGSGDVMAGAVDILPVLYMALAAIMVPLIYLSYRKIAVK